MALQAVNRAQAAKLGGAQPPFKRIGIAGLGKMGILHSAIFNGLSSSRVVAVADPAELPRQALSRFNPRIEMFSTMDQMLNSCSLDAVVIATPVVDHVQLALSCHSRGVPFFIEKPLATSAAQAQPLVLALRRQQVVHMVGLMMRYMPSFECGHRIVQSGCLGRLLRVAGTTYVSQLFAKGKGWRYDKKTAGGGVLLSQGTHLLDLLTWYLGPVVRVNADVVSFYTHGIEDFAHLIIQFRSGLVGWADCSWSVRGRRTLETTIEVVGENGSLRVSDDDVHLLLDTGCEPYVAGPTTWRAADLYISVPFDVGGPCYTREDMAFLDALETPSSVLPDIEQAIHVQQVVDFAYLSATKAGQPQEIALL